MYNLGLCDYNLAIILIFAISLKPQHPKWHPDTINRFITVGLHFPGRPTDAQTNSTSAYARYIDRERRAITKRKKLTQTKHTARGAGMQRGLNNCCCDATVCGETKIIN